MYFAIPNLASDFVSEVTPWEYKSTLPPSLDKGSALRVWQSNTTKHCFISRFEGTFKVQRINSVNNIPCMMHGLIVDYDGNIAQKSLETITSLTPYEVLPSFHCRTQSGKARLFWDFERPIRVPNNTALMKAFLQKISKYLKLNRWLAGFDSDAFLNPNQYYEVGREWTRVSEKAIRTDTLWQWMYEAGQDILWEDKTCRIPIAAIAAEVETKWPGRWQGPFDIGYRSVRFWDPGADNSTAAVIRESGMQCFTGPKAFVPWIEILGKAFVDQYRSTQLGDIASGIFYDGINYWKKDSSCWRSWSKEDVKLELRVDHKLRATSDKKGSDGISEVDHAFRFIAKHNRVEAALPFIHRPEGVITHDQLVYLNTSSYGVLQPSDAPSKELGEGFPWIGKFIQELFNEEALPFFLTWLKHFYTNAFAQTPQDGHAIFLVGDPEVGKSLLATMVVSKLVGGYSDASSFFLGEERFTAAVLSKPVMLIDDNAPSSNHARHTRYSSMIKKVVANKQLTYEQKYQKAGMLPWQGRVIVCCNADPESIRLLPNLDLSIADKLMLFYCREHKMIFPRVTQLEETIQRELPSLARFLMEYQVPPACIGTSRFFAKAYHDSQLVRTSVQSSTMYAFLEVLTLFLRTQQQVFPTKDTWIGTASDLFSAMSVDEGIKPLVGRWNTQQISTYLGQMVSRGYPLTRLRSAKLRTWIIPFNLPEFQPVFGGAHESKE